MEIKQEEIERLPEHFREIQEKRRTNKGNFRHKLVSIVVIAYTSILCGLCEWEEIEEFGKAKEAWFKKFLDLPHGIPKWITFERVFQWINPMELGKALQKWLFEIGQGAGREINIDGKTIRGSADGETAARHVVSAWVNEQSLTLGQVVVDEKSNEITAIPELLDVIDVEGAVVTIDAMGCQTEIAGKIIEKGADYALAVKENQPETYDDLEGYFTWLDEKGKTEARDEIYDYWKSGSEKDHGRIECREAWVVKDIGWMMRKEGWKGIRSIIRVRGHREIKGEKSVFDRYYISSLDVSAERIAGIIRRHWSIENSLHWMMDVAYNEDACKVRKGNAPENLNVLRKMALARLKRAEYPQAKKKMSIRRKMLKALMDDDFRLSLLFES